MLKNNLRLYGLYAVYACSFSLQLSTSAISLCTILFILCWLGSGAIKDLPEILRKYPTAAISTLLFVLFVVGALYSPVSSEVILDTLKEYRVLLYVPIVMCLCKNKTKVATYFLNSFLVGGVIALLASYLLLFGILPETLSYNPAYHSLLSPTPHSGFMALLIYLLLGKLISKEKNAIYGIPFIALALHNVLFLVGSSTGMVILVALMILLALQFFSVKRIAFICLAFLIFAVSLYRTSLTVGREVNEVINTIQEYEIGSGTMHNNVSLRLDWWLSSYWLMKKKPLLGHGTGAFEEVHNKIIKGTNIQPRPHPHNEYWYTGVQVGLVGLLLFILLHAAPFCASFRLREYEKHVLQGIVVFFAIGNMFEGWLIGSATGNFFVIAVAVYVSSQDAIVATA